MGCRESQGRAVDGTAHYSLDKQAGGRLFYPHPASRSTAPKAGFHDSRTVRSSEAAVPKQSSSRKELQ